MATIEQLLAEIKEDKKDNLATTSFKFKTDLWDFFQDCKDKVAVEFGTHKGQTTRILAHLFKRVYTININDNSSGKQLNSDLDNIIYIDNFDLYGLKTLPIEEKVHMALVDAGHDYNQVISDLNRVFDLNCDSECFVVFDDYGLESFEQHVRKAVEEARTVGALEAVKFIGHEPGHSFGGIPQRILSSYEGIITKIIFQK